MFVRCAPSEKSGNQAGPKCKVEKKTPLQIKAVTHLHNPGVRESNRESRDYQANISNLVSPLLAQEISEAASTLPRRNLKRQVGLPSTQILHENGTFRKRS